MTLDEPKTLGERYSTAIQSPNLRVQERESGAADLLIAAGWCDDTLGARLYRLRAEFDSLKASMSGTGNNATTDKVLILSRLKSLEPAKQALGKLAVQQATVTRFMQPDAIVLKLTGRVIDVFLDPSCGHCDGRGFNGGGRHEHTGVQMLCRPCGGSGKRRQHVGKDDGEREFAAHLLYVMERAMAYAETQMARALRRE